MGKSNSRARTHTHLFEPVHKVLDVFGTGSPTSLSAAATPATTTTIAADPAACNVTAVPTTTSNVLRVLWCATAQRRGGYVSHRVHELPVSYVTRSVSLLNARAPAVDVQRVPFEGEDKEKRMMRASCWTRRMQAVELIFPVK